MILGRGRWYLTGLEEHIPDVFVHRAEKLQQHLVLGLVELPQIASPALARKDPMEEHNLVHVDKLDLLAYHVLDTCLEPSQFFH